MSYLITGCNRGLGLGLAKQLAARGDVIATCRDKAKAQALMALAEANPNLTVLELDLKRSDTFNDFAKNVEKSVGSKGLNLLFNNAGVSSKFTRLNMVKEDQLAENFAINTIAPILLTKSLYPILKQTAERNKDDPMGLSRAVVVNMSSILGSIEKNTDGGFYPYRCSKAALNMATRSMSQDFKKEGILACCVHPGWVKTDMGGANAPLDVETSVEKLVELLFSLSEEHNGVYLQYDGTELPW